VRIEGDADNHFLSDFDRERRSQRRDADEIRVPQRMPRTREAGERLSLVGNRTGRCDGNSAASAAALKCLEKPGAP